MAPDEYFWTRDPAAAQAFAARLGTSRATLRNHYFPRGPDGLSRAKVVPSLKRMIAIAGASERHVTLAEVTTYFKLALDRKESAARNKGARKSKKARLRRAA